VVVSGDSEKQWTTAVLTENVTILMLMLATQQDKEDIKEKLVAFLNPIIFNSLICKTKYNFNSKIIRSVSTEYS